MYLKHNEINMPYLLDLTYDIIHSTELEAKFAVTEKKAWQPFWLVVHGFLDIYIYITTRLTKNLWKFY